MVSKWKYLLSVRIQYKETTIKHVTQGIIFILKLMEVAVQNNGTMTGPNLRYPSKYLAFPQLGNRRALLTYLGPT